jgi:hypothetical protein
VQSLKRIRAERPRSAGIAERVPGTSGIEGARLLAAEAFPYLRSKGFTMRQVVLWAETYIAQERSGDVENLLAWIEKKEGLAGPPRSRKPTKRSHSAKPVHEPDVRGQVE